MRLFALFFLLFTATLLRGQSANTRPYRGSTEHDVGSIEFDPSRDRADFHICDSIWIQQYYAVGTHYRSENKRVIQHFAARYQKVEGSVGEGYITVRFLINCKGECDRYRVFQVDRNYQNTQFDSRLVQQLLNLTKELTDWEAGSYEGVRYDSYFQIKFKIRNGQLHTVLI
jgi:hypothetical protein